MSTPSGMRNRSFADIASVRCALSPGQARLVTCQTQQQSVSSQQTRVASHTLPNDSRRDSRRGTRGRERSEPKRASRPIGATEIGRFVAATTTSGPSRSASVVARRSDARAQTLSSEITSTEESDKTASACRLLVCSVQEGVFVLFEPAGGQLRRAPLVRITDRTHGHSRAPWRDSCRCPTGR